jgi:farnesyl-diphosphate farnesyltransferase
MPPGSPLEADRRYSRDVLPRVSRTFALNIRLLAGGLADAVRTAYLLCRSADALEDSWPGPPEAVGGRFDALQAALGGDDRAAERLAAEAAERARSASAGGTAPAPSDPARGPASRAVAARDPAVAELSLVASLPRVLRVHAALPAADREAVTECVRVMASGMRRYAVRAASRPEGAPHLDDQGELHDYCWVVAGCVGTMLTRLVTPRLRGLAERDTVRLSELAPVVGEALQLTNILLDWPSDVRRGRCYVPGTWLAEAGLAPADLVGADRAGVRAIEERLEALARAALARVPEYLALVPRRAVRYRLFVLWPAIWALRSLEHARRDPEFPWGARRPRLPRAALWRAAIASALAPEPGAALRRARATA